MKRNAHNLLHKSALIIKAQAESGSIRGAMEYEVDEVISCMGALESWNMSLTLVHTDFHISNVGKGRKKGCGVFNCGSAFIGHLWCDYVVMTRTTQNHDVNEEDVHNGFVAVWREKVVNMNFE